MKKLLIRLLAPLSVFLLTLSLLSAPNSFAENSLFSTPDTLFSNDDEFLTVDKAFIFDFHQQKNLLKISFNIAEGYYLYRQQFNFTVNNASIDDVVLPKGEHYEDEFFGIQQIYTTPLELSVNIVEASDNASITIKYQGCAKKGLCYPPKKQTISLSAVSKNGSNVTSPKNVAEPLREDASTTKSTVQSEQYQLADMLKGDNLWLTLTAFFVGGLLLAFTPCVFPMYPILTGIIAGQGDNLSSKKALKLSFVYVQGMAITYTLLGIVVALAGAQFQAAFQHPIVLISLSILFIVLALSMFDVFNLALPNSWQNKLTQLSNNQQGGSYLGVLIMGIISGLVASPCTTAPLTAALLYISQSGDIVLGASALYALSLGMGLPLLILGSSGGKLLPKAGQWMNVIKHTFGLLLLAVPVFLLERILSEAISEILWTVLLLASAGYFFTVNQDTKKNFAFGLRSIIIFLLFFFGANKAYQLIYPANANINSQGSESLKIRHFKQVNTLDELKQAIKAANAKGKTVMVDLYADWCSACKEFEKHTFYAKNVQGALNNTELLQIDLTDTGTQSSIELMNTYEVFGLPSILFFDLSGKELTKRRVTGFMPADEFTAHIKNTFDTRE